MTVYEEFQNHIAELSDILNAISILKWDARTQMPPGGAQTRGYQLATLSRLAHEHFASDKMARILDEVEAEIAHEDADSYRARAVRQTRQYYDLVRRIPAELKSRKATLGPVAEQVWADARKNNDFKSFAPYLEQIIDLAKEQADVIGYKEHPFDALVFEFEPSATTTNLKTLFGELKAGLLPLLQRITAHEKPLEKDLWGSEYPVEKQKLFASEMAQHFGYDFQRGRLDTSPHGFEISFTRNDVRITTHYDLHYLPASLYAALHETGHGLYEQGIDPAFTRTALTTDFLGQYAVGGTSYGAHESQSRLWENLVGRSRAFWDVHFDRLREIFPDQMRDANPDLLYRSVNRVHPSLIRVQADEVTYNLHVMLRFEIETALLEGSIKVADLPEIWNAKMQEYLGIKPDSDANGVLQDIHWSAGLLGSFPTYTIGNVMSAQFFEAAHQQVAGLDEALQRGDYAPLLGWLQQNIYRHGRAYDSHELLVRSTGSGLSVKPYMAYLESKYAELYNL